MSKRFQKPFRSSGWPPLVKVARKSIRNAIRTIATTQFTPLRNCVENPLVIVTGSEFFRDNREHCDWRSILIRLDVYPKASAKVVFDLAKFPSPLLIIVVNPSEPEIGFDGRNRPTTLIADRRSTSVVTHPIAISRLEGPTRMFRVCGLSSSELPWNRSEC